MAHPLTSQSLDPRRPAVGLVVDGATYAPGMSTAYTYASSPIDAYDRDVLQRVWACARQSASHARDVWYERPHPGWLAVSTSWAEPNRFTLAGDMGRNCQSQGLDLPSGMIAEVADARTGILARHSCDVGGRCRW